MPSSKSDPFSINSRRSDYAARAKRFRRHQVLSAIGVAALIVVGIAAGLSWSIAWESTTATRTCTVTKADRTMNSKGQSNTRVYTDDCGVLAVQDDMLRGHFNSADVYGAIHDGERMTFHTVGWRFDFGSVFPNIIDAKPAK